jgi:uncharacterized protein (TIGR00296 family)
MEYSWFIQTTFQNPIKGLYWYIHPYTFSRRSQGIRSDQVNTYLSSCVLDEEVKWANESAFKDHRFNPISASELPSLQCAVSILTPTRPISNPLDWTPGQHGIQISFLSKGKRLSATYLPEIATDQGWTREETILSAIQKAGHRGTVVVGDDVWKSLEVGVYESSKAKLSWAEFEALGRA